MATHSSILAWRIPRTEEPGRLQSTGSQSQTWLSDFTFLVWLQQRKSDEEWWEIKSEKIQDGQVIRIPYPNLMFLQISVNKIQTPWLSHQGSPLIFFNLFQLNSPLTWILHISPAVFIRPQITSHGYATRMIFLMQPLTIEIGRIFKV